MKTFFRRVSPKHAVVDLVGYWKQPTQHRWPVLGVAMAATFCIFMLFIPESQRIEPAKPDVIFISTFDETRTEAEIIASNCANQKLKDELQARLEEQEEFRRDMYRTLGRATFIDVDAMEAEIEAERLAAAAAAPEVEEEEPLPPELAMSVEEYCARAEG